MWLTDQRKNPNIPPLSCWSAHSVSGEILGKSVIDLTGIEKLVKITENVKLLERLAQFMEYIKIDPETGDLVLHRGSSRIILKEDSIRIESDRIVHYANKNITVRAGWIDLN